MATMNGDTGNNTLTGTADNDTIYGGAGTDSITGGAGADYLYGNADGDTIKGGTGNDYLIGDDSGYDSYADTYIFNSGDGQDTIASGYTSGYVGKDTIQFGAGITIGEIELLVTGSDSNLTIRIKGSTDKITIENYFASGIYYQAINKLIVGGNSYDLATLVANTTFTLAGDANNNSFSGSQYADIINGQAGNDTIYGQGGNDTINGGADNDLVYGNDGQDSLTGSSGNDSIYGNAYEDTITGGTGNDYLSGDDSYDYYADTFIFNKGDGQDTIASGYTGNNSGYAGKDTIQFGAGIAISDIQLLVTGADANLTISIKGSTDKITIENYFYNNVYYQAIKTLVVGGNSYDLPTLLNSTTFTLSGDANNNSFSGTQYADIINGQGGNDTIYGQGGNDTVNAGADNDLVYGNDGQDSLTGSSGNDSIYGNAYEDTITGGTGNDYLSGDDSYDYYADTFIFNKGDGQDTIASGYTGNNSGYTGKDTIQFGAGIAISDIQLLVTGADANLTISIKGSTDKITIENYFYNNVYYQAIKTLVVGGNAYDLPTLLNSTTFTLSGDANNNSFSGSQYADIINGQAGNDTIYGQGGNDTINGGADNDLVYGNDGQDSLTGSSGNDSIYGNAYEDTITGGTGNDYLSGDDSYDYYADTFIFNKGDGQDTIASGYTGNNSGYAGRDTIQFGAGIAISDIQLLVTGADANLTISIKGSTDKITIENYFYNNIYYQSIKTLVVGGNAYDLATLAANATFSLTGDVNNNSISGTQYADIINGQAGNDTLYGNGGNDSINGGSGDDYVYGYDNDDVLTGGSGNDYLSGDNSYDSYADTFIVNIGDGQDTIASAYTYGNDGKDTIQFGAGITIDKIELDHTGADNNLIIRIKGTSQQITIQEYFNGNNYRAIKYLIVDGNNVDLGSLVASTIFDVNGDANNNTLYGKQYADVIDGLSGNDSLYGYDGNDLLNGGTGDDYLYGYANDDVLSGGKGNDYLSGDDSYDSYADKYIFSLGDGQDTIASAYTYGNEGKDTIEFGAGITMTDLELTVSGVDNNLTIRIKGTNDRITIQEYLNGGNYGAIKTLLVDGESIDLATWVGSSVFTTNGDANANSLSGTNYVDIINGLNGNDTIIGNNGNDSLNGNDGNDYIYGYNDNDVLTGGTGNDYLSGDNSYDSYADTFVFNLGDGQDTIGSAYTSGLDGKDTIKFGTGINLNNLEFTATGSDYNLTIHIKGTSDQITIQEYFNPSYYKAVSSLTVAGNSVDLATLVSNSIINVTGNDNNNSVSGNTYRELINGLAGDDYLYGYGANDTLDGGSGNDYYYGGENADVHIIDIKDNDAANNTDTIMDFSNGVDLIQIENNNVKLTASQITNMLAGTDTSIATVADNGTNTTFSFANGSSLVINNITKGGFTLADFVTRPSVANTSPTGSPEAALATGNEDTAYIVSAANLLLGFSDAEGDSLSVSNLKSNHGTVTDNGNGTFTISPTLNYNGPVTLSYHVIDGVDGSIAATQSFILNPVNDAPKGLATASLPSGGLNTPYIVSVSDLTAGYSDVDGDPLTVSNLVANHGTVINNGNGTYTITPASAYLGTMTLTYNVVDTFGATIAATQDYSVSEANYAPTGSATAVLASGTEDTGYVVSKANLIAGFTDANGDTLNVSNLTANHGTVTNNNNGTFTITPEANYNGLVSLSYNVIDGNGGSIAASQSFTLTAVNDAPKGSPTAVLAAGTEEIAYIVNKADLLAGFTDIEGNTLNISNLSSNHGTVTNNNNGTYTITPSVNYTGVVTLSYNVIDGNSGSTSASQTFTLANVNDAPTGSALGELDHGSEGVAYTVNKASLLVGFSDVDGDTLSISNLTSSAGTVVNNGNGTFTITPASDFVGTLTLNYNVEDGKGGSIAGTQSVVIDPHNEVPTGSATAVLANGSEDTAYIVSTANLVKGFTDLDGDVLTVANITSNHGSVINNGNGTFTISPDANYNGIVSLNYNVTDGKGGSIAASQSFTLNAVNDAPTGKPTTVLDGGTEGIAYTFSAADLLAGFSDIEGNTLTTANVTSNYGSVTNNGDGTYTVKQTGDYYGVVTISYNVQDGMGGSTAATQSFSLASVNDSPKGTPTTVLANGTEDKSFIITKEKLLAGFTDADGDVMNISNLASNHGSISNNGDGTWTVTPATNYNGALSITYRVIDNNGGSVNASLNLSLAAVNDAPTGSATATFANGTEDIKYIITQTSLLQGFSDVDADTLTIANLTSKQGSIVNNGDGTFTFTPTANYYGAVTLSYNVIDGHGGSVGGSRSFSLASVRDDLVLNGTANADTLIGDAIDPSSLDTLSGLAGNDKLYGLAGNDTLNGGSGNDTLDGGTGKDSMDGGSGSDTYILDSTGDVIVETVTTLTDRDTVNSAFTYTLGANLENLLLTGTAVNGTGNELDNNLKGNSVANTLNGLAGKDTMTGYLGNDTYIVDNSSDVIIESSTLSNEIDQVKSSASYTLSNNVERLTLTGNTAINATGNALANTILGNSNANIINGGLGVDTMTGGAGNDTYIVDNTNDKVIETSTLVNEIDLIKSSATYTLGSNIEKLLLTGTTAINATGNNLNNTLNGNNAANQLFGKEGNDTMTGGGGIDTLTGGVGNDTYYAETSTDVIVELADQGQDTVLASASYTLSANVEILRLLGTGNINATGNELNNVLSGNEAANKLDGGTGNDTLSGGIGNDTYVVDSTGDVIKETSTLATEKDSVQSSINYTLGANLENLTLTGTALSGTGNATHNVLTGNLSNNTLSGGTGNDTLDGAKGADTLIGGAGNDTYVVDNAGDIITETSTLATEKDTVKSAINYTLGSTLENLTLIGKAISGTGNDLDNVLTGNASSNTLTGGNGNDIIDGGTGTDTLVGGAGNDVYVIDNSGDSIVETSTLATEKDTVKASISFTLGDNLENLVLTGTDSINGTGNSKANTLTGNSATNTLAGGDGNDLYILDSATDIVVELENQGTDTVSAAESYTLGNNIEKLVLTGTAINGQGNSLNNTLTGNELANTLNGFTGADTMTGGAGNDVYMVDNAGDVILETNTVTTERDTVKSSISYTLGSNLEILSLSGTANLDGFGNNLNNRISGNSGNNVLNGGSGADILTGGAGADSLSGGTGGDTFIFGSTKDMGLGALHDVITDFNSSQKDKIDLSLIDADATLEGNQAFTFVENFSGVAGEVRFEGGIAYINTDTDLQAEFEIQLLGVSSISSTDFLL